GAGLNGRAVWRSWTRGQSPQRETTADPQRAGTEGEARYQRELCARTDGAAHARSGWRIHAKGRTRRCEGLHRVDDPAAAARRRIRVQRATARAWQQDGPGQEDP